MGRRCFTHFSSRRNEEHHTFILADIFYDKNIFIDFEDIYLWPLTLHVF